VVHPTDTNTLLVRATYGILLTHDRGAHWYWICEQSIGFNGFEDPMMGITKNGTLLAGIFDGLSVSKDGGCQWDFEGGPLASRYAIDLSVEKNNPSSAVVVVSNSTGPGMFSTQVFETSDDAASFTQAGVDLPTEFLGLTLDPAPSDPNRIYVSGRYGAPDYQGVLERTPDRGKTWEKLPIPGSNDTLLPYIGAIDPNNPDLVYVRLDGDPSDKLIVSKDGGVGWNDAFVATGNLLGFALSPDGSTVAVGGETDGLWLAPSSTLQFQKVSDLKVRCLTWASDGLYACADEFTDGFTVGVSTDNGKSFEPLMHLKELCGPLACDANTSTGKECPMYWGQTSLSLGDATCGDTADAGADGGSSSSSSSGGGNGSGEGGDSSSCACSTPGGAIGSMLPALASLAAAALLRARRRAQRR